MLSDLHCQLLYSSVGCWDVRTCSP